MKTQPAWGIAAAVPVLANVVFLAWSHGALAAFGLLPERLAQAGPHRLDNQVRPSLLRAREEIPPAVSPSDRSAR